MSQNNNSERVLYNIIDRYAIYVSDLAKEFFGRLLVGKAWLKIAEAHPKYFVDSLMSFFALAHHREPDCVLVRIVPSVKKNSQNNDEPFSVIEVIVSDMPFLVDSIIEELKQHHIPAINVIHSVMAVKRDSLDDLIAFEKVTAKNIEQRESFIQIYVPYLNDNELVELLTANIQNIISHHVEFAVRDWQLMDKKINEVEGNADLDDGELTFCRWLRNDNFIFLGYVECKFAEEGDTTTLDMAFNKNKVLGILKSQYEEVTSAISQDNNIYPGCITIKRISYNSLVHNRNKLDTVIIEKKDNLADIFVGLFTTSLDHQAIPNIPILNNKMAQIINHSGLSHIDYTRKELVSILEDFPKRDLFYIPAQSVKSLMLNIFDLSIYPKIKIFTSRTNSNHFISIIVVIPKERFKTQMEDQIHAILSRGMQINVCQSVVQIATPNIIKLHVTAIAGTDYDINKVDIENLEEDILRISGMWIDSFRSVITQSYPGKRGHDLLEKYQDAFPTSYKDADIASGDLLPDIDMIEQAIAVNRVLFSFVKLSKKTLRLKMYCPGSNIVLSNIVSILENMGSTVITSNHFIITPKSSPKLWLYNFVLDNLDGENNFSGSSKITQFLEEALDAVWYNKMHNDAFNKLVMATEISWRQVALLRAFSHYLRQIGIEFSYTYLQNTLLKHAEIAKLMIHLFDARFAPDLGQHRISKVNMLLSQIDKKMNEVDVSTEDKILRYYIEVVNAIVRTNYFQFDSKGNYKNYISFKINSKALTNIPKPCPHAEIFVHSPHMEGIHLRGGRVARGGIRWSDRLEDYRKEVLGLMKAQMCKNSIIVPTGAKGGFVLTGKLNVCDRDKIQQEAILAYKTLLSGMLDLTDNINDKDTIKPANTICYDEDSPYLVVAADKGTSTFSDIANTVSCERGFWLGDAFASGGSVGYDHKKIGITARGAWFSLDRHCKEAGIDLNDSFTVIGIGDMSGDVFGNAMLLSNKIKLVAAFDHRHIFMDPDPDPEASYKERSRLFKLPRSSWIDYDRSVLSANGGIFERESKRILLNESMQDILGISDIEISGEQLIQAILKAPVDIFWNGGIGTYVKASTESNEQVGDKTNDAVRINACDLRCKVVVEGGNLGFTQKARIEYAQKGGFINTDAIDNSAGVDCSDHEVNIKIALSLAVTQGKISIKERDNILREMTEEVANNVYQDNRLQNQSITIEQKEVTTNMFLYSELMDVLEHEGILRRDIEYLPNKQTMIQRMNCGNVLTRPELAVLLSYSKMSLSRKIANCNLTQFDGLVMSYFPQRMRESFANKIKAHPLKNDIIATIMTNDIVHHLGINYCNIELSNEPAINIVDLVHMYIAVREIFDLKQIWQNIEDLSMSVGNSNVFNTQVKLFYEVRRFAQRAVSWMMRNMHNKISDMVSIKVGVESFFANIDKILPDDLSLFYQGRFYTYKSLTIADDLANKMAKLDLMRYSYGLLKLSTFLRKNMVEAAKVHFAIADVLQLKWLYDNLEDMCINDYWTRITVSGLRDDLTYIHRKLTEHIVVARKEKNTSEAITAWLETLETNFIAYKEIIKEIQEQAKIDINMLSTAIHKLRPLLPASVRNNT